MKKSKNKKKEETKKDRSILEILSLPKGTKVYESSVYKIMDEIRYGKKEQEA